MSVEKHINLSFKDIENLGILKRFQRDLNILTGLAFDFVDIYGRSSSKLKALKSYTSFCQLVNSTDGGRIACESCDIEAWRECYKKRKPIVYRCHLGLIEIAVPLIIQGEVLGFLTSGQFMNFDPDKKKFKKIESEIKKHGISLPKAKKRYYDIPVIKKEKAMILVDLISIIAEHIVEAENKILALRKHYRSDRIWQAQEYINLHFTEQISLEAAASASNLSVSRFQHVFREKLNTTLTSYVNDLRINEAKNMLMNTDRRITGIAFQSGFRNLSHFNRVFKKKVGCTPGEYRKQQHRI